MTFHSTDNMRLEVEVEPEGLANLIPNPSGDLGTWGWVTPVANTYITAYEDGRVDNVKYPYYLSVRTEVAQNVHFISELLPCNDAYVAARYTTLLGNIGLDGIKVRFDFYNADRTYISSSAYAPIVENQTNTTHYVPAAATPAGTAYVAIRFDLYADTLENMPQAGAWLEFAEVMVTHAATTGELQSTRTNLVANPSFETNTDGWTGGGTNITRSTFTSSSGSATLRAEATRRNCRAYYTPIAVSGGKTYAYQAQMRRAAGSGQGHLSIDWVDANGDVVSRIETDPVALTTTYALFSMVATAPSEATHAVLNTNFREATVGDLFFVDAVLLERGTETKTYFDGSKAAAGGRTYVWNGTAHGSTSREISSNYDFLEPGAWQDILGPTHEISIERQGLDVGIMSATILDAMLDPAKADTIRPGKNIRLMTLVDDVWEPVYTGRLTNAHVTYPRDKRAGSKVETHIQLTASDNIAVLANQGEGTGVANIDELPYLLEGKGVPWNINGSGNQVTSASVVSWNENASVLDQIAITRDSNLGYAWVDKRNVLNAYDASWSRGGFTCTFSDTTADTTPDNPVIPNAGFEESGIGFWQPAYSGEITLTNTTEQAHSGTHSLKVVTEDPGAGRVDFRNGAPITANLGYIAIQPNNEYTFSFWSYAAAGMPALAFRVYGLILSETGSYVGGFEDSVGTIAVGEWTKHTITFNSMPKGARLYINPYSSTNNPAGRVYYFDDFSLVNTTLNVSYTDIDVDFDLDRCINSVSVKWLRYDIGNDSTTEITYGPYENKNSIAKWGARTATFTIHGQTESSSTIAAYAQSILTANANPKVKANSLTMPVRNKAEFIVASRLDLYDSVGVDYSGKVNDTYRITSIKHIITPEKWLVTYAFGDTASVAAPTWTPSPPFKGADTTVTINCSGDATGSFTLVKNGHIVTMFGYCDYDTLNTGSNAGTFAETGAVIPAGWRPTSSMVGAPYAPYGSTGLQYRYRINTAGTTDGKVLVQRTGTNGTFMTIDSLMWEV